MAGVWVFKDGVTRLVQNPLTESVDGTGSVAQRQKKVLVYLPTNETISNYEDLEEKLLKLGWKPYLDGGDAAVHQLRQYHKSSCTLDLISLPHNFANFKTMHMYDIVVKNRNAFEVRDAAWMVSCCCNSSTAREWICCTKGCCRDRLQYCIILL